MAPFPESTRLFQKLKIDTSSRKKPVQSTFASINTTPSAEEYIASDTTGVSSTRSHGSGKESSLQAHFEKAGDGETSPTPAEGFEAAPAVGNTFRGRQTSISFDPKVTLESGNRLALDEPLPKAASSSGSRIYASSKNGLHFPHVHENTHRTFSESQTDNYDPLTGEPLDVRRDLRQKYRKGEQRHPLLQSTVNELVDDPAVGDHARTISPMSAAAPSSAIGDPSTPLESSADYLQSPLSNSSPIDLPSYPWHMSQRSSSLRSRSYRSERSSLGSVTKSSRPSRRNTTRSVNSSMSPASAFLGSLFSPTRDDSAAVAPDEEGQEIGDHSEYIIGKRVGFGGFSVVKEVFTIDKKSGERIRRAVKIVRKEIEGKSELQNEDLQSQFEHQISIWRYLNHPHILRLLAVYETPFATFCITNLYRDGTLFDLVRKERKARNGGLIPHIAKRYVYQLSSAIHYLHDDMHIAHRDIKLENCLLDMSAPKAEKQGGNILLCDFGMADFITHDSRESPGPFDGKGPAELRQNIGPSNTSTTVTGSIPYAAPEVFSTPYKLYSPAVDMWAFGVVVHALLTGRLPFQHDFQAMLRAMIEKGEWDVKALQDTLMAMGSSDEEAASAAELVQGCLESDPEERWTISDVLACRWLEGCGSAYEVQSIDGL